MYLKALELQGFKSFPDKTRITFEKDVTAIVGPNGSGKSNIADAILWVMGEQRSKTLRGGKMEDVIFGGTEKRGALGFAQVSLIIDNSEHIFDCDSTELMLTRRYYRSGDSEYYINREAVRLKDINSLLMDTGLGRDGYSIIGQGKIAEIVSTKSTDRREVFEEAAAHAVVLDAQGVVEVGAVEPAVLGEDAAHAGRRLRITDSGRSSRLCFQSRRPRRRGWPRARGMAFVRILR